MSISLEMKKRDLNQTKGEINLLRQQGWIPAIVYGNNEEPQGLSILAKPFLKELETPGVRTRVYSLGDLGLVLVKEMQFLSVKDTPIHMDFLRLKERVVVSVRLKFVNEDKCPGIKRGGVLNVIHYSVEISAPSISIPQEIIVDLSGVEIGNTLHLSDIVFPEGVHVLNLTGDESVVSIVSPSGLTESLKD